MLEEVQIPDSDNSSIQATFPPFFPRILCFCHIELPVIAQIHRVFSGSDFSLCLECLLISLPLEPTHPSGPLQSSSAHIEVSLPAFESLSFLLPEALRSPHLMSCIRE